MRNEEEDGEGYWRDFVRREDETEEPEREDEAAEEPEREDVWEDEADDVLRVEELRREAIEAREPVREASRMALCLMRR